MELIRTWILSVTVSAIVIAVAEALMPPGAVKKGGKLTGGRILVLGILQPLVTMDYEDLYDMVTALPAGAIAQEEAQTHQYEAMKGIIEEELEAYIVDKGEALGADCTAQVTCTPGEGEVPRPPPPRLFVKMFCHKSQLSFLCSPVIMKITHSAMFDA